MSPQRIIDRVKEQGILVSALGILLLLLFIGPLFVPVSNGAGEGMELSKAFQMNGPSAWHQGMWNDQPLLLDELYRISFFLLGPHAWVARLVNMFFLGVLLVSLSALIPRTTPHRWLGIGGVWLLLLSHSITWELSSSAMKELPAFSLAVASLALVGLPASDSTLSKRFFISGCIFAAAVQVKYTALMLAPSVVCALVVAVREDCSKQNAKTTKHGLMAFGILGGAFGLVSVALILCFSLLHPDWSWTECFRSHWGPRLPEYAAEEAGYQYSWSNLAEGYWFFPLLFLGSWECLRSGRRQALRLLVPLVLVGVVCGVHLVHRPYWYYYSFHFVIAFVVWAAVVVGPLLKRFFAIQSQPAGGFGVEFACLLAAGSLYMAGPFPPILKLISFSKHYNGRSESALVQIMRTYAGETQWIYTQENFLAFQAQLPIPPNLVLLVKKRFWSGQIDREKILKEVISIEPEQMLLKRERELQNPAWVQWIATHYTEVTSQDGLVLYVHQRLNPKPIPKSKDTQQLFKSLGLNVSGNKSEQALEVKK